MPSYTSRIEGKKYTKIHFTTKSRTNKSKMSRYELISEIKINDDIPVKKYLLPDSNILVYIAEVSSPLTNCYLSLGKILALIFFCSIFY